MISLVYSVVIGVKLVYLDNSLQTDFNLDHFYISGLFKLTNFHLLEKLLDHEESNCNFSAKIKTF